MTGTVPAGASEVQRWSVVIADLEPIIGHEQGGARRCLVVSNEPFHRSGMITVCPISASWGSTRYPNEVGIKRGTAGQSKDGSILCHQVRTISVGRLISSGGRSPVVGYLDDPAIREDVKSALSRHFWLNRPD